MHIYIDADACPRVIRDILFKASQRTKVPLTLIANHSQTTPATPWINSVQVSSGFDKADDEIVRRCEQGDLIIARLTPQGYQEISRAKLIEPTRRVQRRMTIWSHPAFAMQSVFARNDKELVRVSLAAGQ